jgi:hypothetical protein
MVSNIQQTARKLSGGSTNLTPSYSLRQISSSFQRERAKCRILSLSADRPAFVSAHHITQASGKGIGSGVLIDEQGSDWPSRRLTPFLRNIKNSYISSSKLDSPRLASGPLSLMVPNCPEQA